jgi:dTMP kinase
MRRRWLESQGVAALSRPETAAMACASVTGLDDGEAWWWRRDAFAAAPVAALTSLAGLVSEEAWRWRERALASAPAVILRTIRGIDAPMAWAMRELSAARCTEALDSLDGEAAWRLRERCADLWPWAVVKSLRGAALCARGEALLARQLACHGNDVAVLRHATGCALALIEDRPAAASA